MKKILILLLFTQALIAQVRLNQLQPYVINYVRQDSGFIMTNNLGIPRYIPLSLLTQIINNKFDLCTGMINIPNGNYDSTDYVIVRTVDSTCKAVRIDSIFSPTNLCNLFGQFGTTGIDTNDYVLVKKANGECKKVKIGDFGSMGFSKIMDGECIDLEILGGDTLKANLVISPDANNVLECRVNGAYVPSLCAQLANVGNGNIADNDKILAINGSTCKLIRLDSILGRGFDCDDVEACLDSIDLSDLICAAFGNLPGRAKESGDSVIVQNGGVCAKVPFPLPVGAFKLFVRDSDCIDLILVNDSTISAKVIISPDAGNDIECRGNGLYAASSCEAFTTAPTAQLTEGDYLYMARTLNPPDCRKIVWDLIPTNCINLVMDAGGLKASVVISPDAGNKVECRANGLYATNNYTLTCDTINALFPDGVWAEDDEIFATNASNDACKKVPITQYICQEISMFNNTGTLSLNDEVLVSNGAGNCVKKTYIPDGNGCPTSTTTSYTYVIVQDGDGSCFRITCANFKLYLNGGSCL